MGPLVLKINMKEELLKKCESYLEEKIDRISHSIQDLEASLTNESKSSAGDKYETGREMINIEINKHSSQLQQFQKLQETLKMAKQSINTNMVKMGNLVETTNAFYFICIPIGEVVLGNEKIYIIGAASPIAQALIGKSVDDTFNFNAISGRILSIS